MSYRVQIWNNNVITTYTISDVRTALAQKYTNREEIYTRIKEIASDKRCAYAINPTYIDEVFLENNIYLIFMRETGEDIGYVLARHLVDGGVYLDVICSFEAGAQLLKFFIALCEINSVSYIELSSLINVLAYYPTLGFEHRKECTPGKGADIAMSEELREYIKSQMKAGILTDFESYYKDPYVLNYLMELHKHKFTNTEGDAYPESCTDKKITGAQFAQRHCGRNGFTMRKCLSIPSAPTRLSVAKSAYTRSVKSKKTTTKKRHIISPPTNKLTTNTRKLSREAKQLLKNAGITTLPTKRAKKNE